MAIRNPFLTSKSSKPGKPPMSLKERFSALKNLPGFLKLIWQTSPGMTLANIFLRIVRSVIPLLTLYVAKLIIDEVIRLTQTKGNDDLDYLFTLVAIEFGLAILSDVLNRATALLDSLLGDLFSNATSIRLMNHAATLDLQQFEDATFYDKLERARRQTLSRTILMSQVLSQMQDAVTLFFLAIGLVAFNPWLIVL